MPKIKTMRLLLQGDAHEVELHYGIQDKFYARKLPEGFDALPNARRLTCGVASLELLESNIQGLTVLFREAKTTSRQVIIISASLNTGTRDALNIGHFHQLAKLGRSTGHGFDFSYKLAKEVKFGGNTKYIGFDQNPGTLGGAVSTDSRDIIVDYTEEREVVLKQLIEQTTKLGKMLATFFGDTPEQLALNMDNGLKLLN